VNLKNIDRIYQEIQKKSREVAAQEDGVDPELLTDLVMRLIKAEQENLERQTSIRQNVRTLISNAVEKTDWDQE
tara:strand:- start:201 stop:422 length:222 start_codon:yes stop_codon:yes gene_type:complete